ncbi:MAG: hypothetical protein A3F82_04840 [Deltaproteobacteria bacterium RIFCSPLOWO2_12_FULL_44_12]|nr:MAG: hypothetical protein A2712_05890 [Deltaproteobacteria bacterium RIFCSPHIGHO2_01_FULL_43_49]OGQ16662.1 MAG: hypothetical protein A3D22_07015 [Deltaproteobacteria bacterium RIFCSPHIGHO2_02_FULL_44_53]OGQ29800.1 MAG: hypothetical protein A3D98_09680 [Deltaproteobacteria bacterium RIFCSPHIGHO2_12_FULL_44_21]OGQ33090.1 MAG: hypothetical protein A2979_03660 [Deltaproteobacteria bacterium RIFCSPLOWO2_01_FULL_45_74]OGQ42185.1 MAG: hypothetical protein A3I70_05965 [Deltaproteobacteria bacterium 
MPQTKHVYLCLPPNYSYNYLFPPLGTPCLTGFLKAKGYPVTQADHNMVYFEFLLEKISVSEPIKIKNDVFVKKLLNRLFEKKAKCDLYYADCLPKENDEYVPYQDNTNSSFYFTERMLASQHLERYLEDETENTFLQFFLEKKIAQEILEGDYHLLGLSVISPSQVLPVLTLCNLIKKTIKDFPIILGGQWPSLFRMELSKWPKLVQWVDGVIFDEGETPLYEYLQVLEGRQSITDVPNLFFFENGKAHFNRKRTEEDINALPPPDFDGMPLDRYVCKEDNGYTTVTYQTSRECYWNRCTYCVDLPFPKHTYREKNVNLVIRDIRELQERYGAKELVLSDLAMAPSYMRKLSKRILEEGLQIRWWTFSRLDGALNRELFDLAKKAGCYHISYGFESANQRVCDFVDKGTKLDTMARVIKDCGSSGIKVTLQTMIGLPSETMDEALDTISFLLEHRHYIDNVCYNIYYLTPGNYIYRDPEKNQVILDDKNRLPFQFFLGFRHAQPTGIPRDKAKALIRFYECQLKKLKGEEGERPLDPLPEQKPLVASIQVGREKARLFCFRIPHSEEWVWFPELPKKAVNYETNIRDIPVYSCP